ncbi:TPA: hypothetical protein G8W59_004206 [Salmonella enterica]|uniref:NAD(+)--protein-arginine ADP-ribosyltransferase n=1 Tax=Salmonella enterica TaxID=28901 RepID=A0A759KBF7_SALER|nr:hypothetical protein [Salmonella enterica]
MSIISSFNVRRMMGLHISGDEMKSITNKYQNGNVSNADKSIKRDIKRISNTINNTNKPKCHEMAKFLTSIKNTSYYTSTVKKSLDQYIIKHGTDVIEQNPNKSSNINESEYLNARENSLITKVSNNNECENMNPVFNNNLDKHEYANLGYSTSIKENGNNHENSISSSAKNIYLSGGEYANICSARANDALQQYTGNTYKELNNALRNNLTLRGTMQEIKKGLDEIFAKNPNFGSLLKTFRGVPHKTNISHLKEGEIIEISGFLSTSRDIKVANDFASGIDNSMDGELNIIFGMNHKDVSSVSLYPFEQEELYPHGTKFMKLFQHDIDGVRVNILEEVSNNLTDVNKNIEALDLSAGKEAQKTHKPTRKSVLW